MDSKAWSGRFGTATDRAVEKFTASIATDHRLWRHDIWASKAHVHMLSSVGLLSKSEGESIEQALEQIAEQFSQGKMTYRDDLEDVHMHIEAALIEALGDVGRKLHTARSRNDQVATSLRLWTRDAIDEILEHLDKLQKAFLTSAHNAGDTILPGYTHLQRAQPVLAAHYFLAHVERFERDRERLIDARKRVNISPLGSAALAGTSLPIDREQVRQALGFSALSRNSMDAVSDRDFVVETIFALNMIAIHLSSWAEEWILWNSQEFNFIELPDALCTGSSIMPHKKNPDVLELIRGRTGRVNGSLQTLLMILKGLPLAYNRDLQEDKPALFDAIDCISSCLNLAAVVTQGAKLKTSHIKAQLSGGFLDATTLMEALILAKVPMRTAHGIVGTLVRTAENQGITLSELPTTTLAEAHSALPEIARSHLGVNQALASFQSLGSTAPARVAAELLRWHDLLNQRETQKI